MTPEQWAGLNKPELAQAMAGMVTMVQTSQQQVGQLSAAVQQLTSKPAAPPVSRTIMSKPAPKDKLTLGKMSGASKAHNLLVWFMNTDASIAGAGGDVSKVEEWRAHIDASYNATLPDEVKNAASVAELQKELLISAGAHGIQLLLHEREENEDALVFTRAFRFACKLIGKNAEEKDIVEIFMKVFKPTGTYQQLLIRRLDKELTMKDIEAYVRVIRDMEQPVTASTPPAAAVSSDRCSNCYKPGHFARDCRSATVCDACGKAGHRRHDCWEGQGGRGRGGGQDSSRGYRGGGQRGGMQRGRGGRGGSYRGSRGGRSGGRGGSQSYSAATNTNHGQDWEEVEEETHEGEDKTFFNYALRQALQRVGVVATTVTPMTAELRIEGRRLRVIIDTGSVVSLITRATLLRICPKPHYEAPGVHISSVDGSDVKITGAVRLLVNLPEPTQVRFLVTEQLPSEALIGMDVLNRLIPQISLGEKRMKFSRGNIKVTTTTAEAAKNIHTAVAVTAEETTRIPANSAAFVPIGGAIHSLSAEGEGRRPFLLQPILNVDFNELPADCLIVPALVNFEGNLSSVLVHNTTDKECTVEKGKTIAIAKRADEGVLQRQASLAMTRGKTAGGVGRKDDVVTHEQIKTHVRTMKGLDPEQKKRVEELLLKYRDIFRNSLTTAGGAKVEPMRINTETERPIRAPIYVKSPKEEKTMHDEVDKLLDAGVIRDSKSPWNAPVIIVPKKDGGLRFCVDFRRLNDATKKEVYPMPRIDRALEHLSGSQWYSTFDMLSGYWQVKLTPDTIEKTAFSVPGKGHFEFVVVPMGATNAPAHFQRVMDLALHGLTWGICLVYLDDIIVFSNTFDEQVARLDTLLGRLKSLNMLLKFSKCKFFLQEIEFLGHVVSGKGVKPDQRKVEAIARCQPPKNVKELRSFLGAVNHFRRFIHRCAQREMPLLELLRRENKWVWGPGQQASFEDLRTCLMTPPILRHANFSKPFIVFTDASDTTISATLMQREENGLVVVSYWSKALTPTERRYGAPQRELLAVVQATKQFRRYLYGSNFVVWTDQKSLVDMLGTELRRKELEPGTTGRLLLKLTPFMPYMTIKWIEGKKNVVADALTRAPFISEEVISAFIGRDGVATEANVVATIAALRPANQVATVNLRDIAAKQHADTELRELIDFMQDKGVPKDKERAAKVAALARHMVIEDGVLYMTMYPRPSRAIPEVPYQLAIPKGELREQLLEEYHAAPLGGHLGRKKVLQRLGEKYWWPSMSEDVTHTVESCRVCQERRMPRVRFGEMQPIEVTEPFDTWTIDFAGPFTTTDAGNKHIFVMVDNASKAVELKATKTNTMEDAANAICERVISRYGAPRVFISDQAAIFTSGLMKRLCTALGTKQHLSLAHHPQSHGQVERTIRTVEQMISAYTSVHQRDWDSQLWKVEGALRMTPNETTGVSPFRMLHGLEAKLPIDHAFEGIQRNDDTGSRDRSEVVIQKSDNESVSEYMGMIAERRAKLISQRAEETRQTVVKNVKDAKEKQKEHHDQRHKKPSADLDVGKLVMCEKKTQEIPATSRKLTRPFEGPYKVTEAPNNLNRKIQLVSNPAKQLTVHVERLKPFVEDGNVLTGREDDEYDIGEILQERKGKKGMEYLVRWKGYTAKYDTWEPVENFDMECDAMLKFKQRPAEQRRQPATQARKRPMAKARASFSVGTR